MAPPAIRVVSDVICPWCWVGKRHLDASLAKLGLDGSATIEWHPFMLRPKWPENGMAKPPATPDNPRVPESIRVAGAGAGIEFTGKCDRVPNTLKAHTLLKFALLEQRATGEAVQHRLAEALFHRYFTAGDFPGDSEVLRSAAREAGLDADAAVAYAEDPARQAEVFEEAQANRASGVTGVPTFFLNGRRLFSGAQPVERFLQELAQE